MRNRGWHLCPLKTDLVLRSKAMKYLRKVWGVLRLMSRVELAFFVATGLLFSIVIALYRMGLLQLF